jgi:epoxyqueuosine reductase QueG
MDKITKRAKNLALSYGATAVGVVTSEMLVGGPPSTDLSYVLPKANSAISFAVPLNQNYIESWFSKQSHADHLQNNIQANVIAGGISLELANYLNQKGYPSVPLTANTAYRTDSKNGIYDERPPVSHRYLAVRSGVGFFGLSGNVLTPTDGAAIILGSVITEARLIPTEPIAAAKNYCDLCRLCKAVCASGYIHGEEMVSVTMGGMDFSYSRKMHHSRCDYVCGGFTGLHKSGKWSTWSPARFNIPDKDEGFYPALINAVGPFLKRKRPALNVYNVLMPGDRVELTCGNCQLICHPDKEIRKKRYKLLIESGVVVENPDGTRESVLPEEAKKRLAAMDPATRALYEEL